MNTHLRQQQTIGVITGNGHGRCLDPSLVPRLPFDYLDREVAAFGPPQIRADEHLGPVLRLGAAGAGMNRQNGVLVVVLAAEHLLDLAGLHLRGKRVERHLELLADLLTLAGPVDQHLEVAHLLVQ